MQRNGSRIQNISSILSNTAGKVIAAALMVLVLYTAIFTAFKFGHSIFYQKPMDEPPGRDIELTVERGESLDEFADELKSNGLISDSFAFLVQAKLYKISFYPGKYTINTSMTTKEILQVINLTEEEYKEKLEREGLAEEKETDVIGGGMDGE